MFANSVLSFLKYSTFMSSLLFLEREKIIASDLEYNYTIGCGRFEKRTSTIQFKQNKVVIHSFLYLLLIQDFDAAKLWKTWI